MLRAAAKDRLAAQARQAVGRPLACMHHPCQPRPAAQLLPPMAVVLIITSNIRAIVCRGFALLHRIGWSVQAPARWAAKLSEAQIASQHEALARDKGGGGGPRRLALFRRRIGLKLNASYGPHQGHRGPTP
jgi:hypothetical protein